MNLDGETNLKEKFVFDKNFNPQRVSNFHGTIDCDVPNESLEEWDGNIHFDNDVTNCK